MAGDISFLGSTLVRFISLYHIRTWLCDNPPPPGHSVFLRWSVEPWGGGHWLEEIIIIALRYCAPAMSLTLHHSCQWNDYPHFTDEETEARRGKVTHLRKWMNWNLNSALTRFSTIFCLYSQNMYLPTFPQPHCYHLGQPLSHLSSLFPGLPDYIPSPHLFPVVQMVRIYLQCRRPRFDPWVEKILWRREWQSTPLFLPEESHGQRSLAGVAKSQTWLRD